MQNTLLGLAIACILALLAALIGPHVVDWSSHRAFFEKEASRIVGLPVRVKGEIAVGILPFPKVTLGGIEIGPRGEAARLRAGALGIELGLAPLLRGEFRAVELHLGAPEFSVGLNSLGQVDWPSIQLGTEALAIDRLRIDDGRVVLADARSGSRIVLDKLWFTGEVRSLAGPVRGEGAFTTGGAIHGYRVSAGRFSSDGMRLRFSVDSEGPLKTEMDGTVSFERGAPRFDGQLTMARSAGSVQPGGKATINEPWQLTSKVNASTRSMVLEQVAFQYGAAERAATLNGSAVLRFGEHPRLEGALSARQVDVDRLIATPAAPRRLPLAAIQTFAETFGGAMRFGLPVTLGISVDALTIGGATLQAVGCDLRSDGTAWNLEKLEFRAPGFTQARMSGLLDPSARALGFSGEVRIDANDPRALAAWLAGRPSSAGVLKPWQLRGHLTLGADRIVVERLHTEFDRGMVDGRLAYFLSEAERPARLDAELRAAELDLDALIGFADGALSGTGFEPPREVALAIEIGKARLAGLEARSAAARLKFDSSGIAIERLAVADFGGAKVEASGRIDTTASPGGTIAVDLDARELNGVIALADKFAKPLAGTLRLLAGRRHNTAKLHATVSLEQASDGAAGKLSVAGRIGAVRVAMNAAVTGKPEAFAVTDLRALEGADIRLNGRIDADDGGVVLALAGLDRGAAAGQRPGSLSFTASGPLSRDLRIDTSLNAGPIDVTAKGTLRPRADLPAEFGFDQVSGTIGGSNIQGKLVLALGDPVRLEGALEVDALDAPAVIAAAIGMPAAGKAQGTGLVAWSSEPFAQTTSTLAGQIELKARRANLAPAVAARQLQGVVRFGASQVVFDEFTGELGRGRFDGRLAIASGSDGVTARARVTLSGADAGSAIATDGHPAVAGRLGFEAEIEGAGMSPAAFVGSLSGKGRIRLDDAHLAGLNPRVFDAVIRAVDLGIPTDSDRVRDFVTTALGTASLPVKRIEVPIDIAAGRARLGPFTAAANGVDFEGSANVGLADAILDSQFTLAGVPAVAGAPRPMIFIALRGPLAAPKRTIDANALATWLALRSVEQQSQRLDAAERERARREALALPPADPVRKPQAAPPSSENTPPVQAVPPSAEISVEPPREPPGGLAPPLPAPINVRPPVQPRAVPRAELVAPQPARRVVPRNPPPPSPGPPLNLLGAQR